MWTVISKFEIFNTIWSLFTIILRALWKRCKLYYYSLKMKGPVSVPFLGSVGFLFDFRNTHIETVMHVCEKYKPVAKVWIGPHLFVVTTKPDHVEILSKACVGKMTFYEYVKQILGNGLLTAPADIWKVNRKILNPAFNQNTLNSFIGCFQKHSENAAANLKKYNNVEVDVFEILFRCYFSILHETCLSYSDVKNLDLYFVSLPRLESAPMNRFTNLLYHFDFIWKFSSDSKYLDDFVLKSYNHHRQIITKKKRDQNYTDKNFINILMKMSEKKVLGNQEVFDEIQTIILTGTRTPTVGLCFTLIMLALHHEIQDKAYREIVEIFGQDDRDVTYEDINQMVYCERVIKETLRLFPPSPVILRDVQEEIFLGFPSQNPGTISNMQLLPDEYVVPEGSTWVIPIIYIHRDANHWPDPLKFDPDRFLPEETAKRHRCAYFPFSIPPRNCIGYKFAMMSMKVILATVLRRYKVVSSQYKSLDDIRIELNASLEAVEGYGLTFESRF